MDRVHSVDERPVAEIEHVAVAIKSVDAHQRHLAILHRDLEMGDIYRLELAWHHDLRNTLFKSKSYLWVNLQIPPLRARMVAAKCRQIWRANRDGRIPYGFGPPTDCFDPMTHEYLIGPTSLGLTCASFVLAVFAHTGIHLIEYSTWPENRAEDRQWQIMIANRLEADGADPNHIQTLRSVSGMARFRPEEVAAAATLPIPCSYHQAEPIAAAIVQRLSNFQFHRQG